MTKNQLIAIREKSPDMVNDEFCRWNIMSCGHGDCGISFTCKLMLEKVRLEQGGDTGIVSPKMMETKLLLYDE